MSSSLANAQLELSGTIDVQAQAGGERSSYVDNGIPSDYNHFHVNIAQLNLIGFAPISDEFFFETRLAFTNRQTGELGNLSILLANLTYAPTDEFSLSAGRFITPFGFYADRQLVIDRTFVELPIQYSYFTNVSSSLGLIGRKFRYNGTYSGTLSKLNTNIFYDGYHTGLRFDWDVNPGKFDLSGALTNGAVSQYDWMNIPAYGGMLRARFNPSAAFEWSLSGSHGSYFEETPENIGISDEVDLESYTQTAVAAHAKIQLTYFEIVSEAVLSQWTAPVFNDTMFFRAPTDFVRETDGSLSEATVSNLAANVDIKYEFPNNPGVYFAVRGEGLFFDEIDNPADGSPYKWDSDLFRYQVALAKKFTPNVVGKLIFTDQDSFNFKYYTFRMYLTAAF